MMLGLLMISAWIQRCYPGEGRQSIAGGQLVGRVMDRVLIGARRPRSSLKEVDR